MKNFKIKKVGVDLRNSQNLIPDITLDNINLDYIILDLLNPRDYYIHDFCYRAITEKGVKIIISVDLEKFNKEDPWREAAKVLDIWEDSTWSLPWIDPIILFKNLPKNPKPGTIPSGLGMWNDAGYTKGLEITNFEGWLEQVDNWKTYFDGKSPEYVARSISPLYYNMDLEKWFNLSLSKTIGLDWHGGKDNQVSEKEVFGSSYLLAFAGLNSEIVTLPIYSSFLSEASQQIDFLYGLVDREIDEKEEQKFVLKKSVSRLKSLPKKIVYESMRLPIAEKTWIIPSEGSSVIYPYGDTSYSFSKPRQESYPLPVEPTELDFTVKDAIDLSLGEYARGIDPEVAWRLISLSVITKLREKFPAEERWEFEYVAIGRYAMGINLIKMKKRKWYEKYLPDEVSETRDFLLIMDAPDKINFVDLDNLPETIEKED